MKTITGIFSMLLMVSNGYAEDITPAPITEAPAKEITAQQPAEMIEQSGFSRGSVVRSAFTTSISEREPTDSVESLTSDAGQVMFFTELRDMSGQTAVHRWEHDGKVMAEVEFNVRGPRWRIWSSKNLIPSKTGDWTVSVINGAGEVISAKTLNVEMAAAEMPASTDTSMPSQAVDIENVDVTK